MSTFDQQLAKIQNDKGFIAALDQSGGSTPKALKLYGVEESAWKDGRRVLVCGLDTGGEGDITGSVKGTRR